MSKSSWSAGIISFETKCVTIFIASTHVKRLRDVTINVFLFISKKVKEIAKGFCEGWLLFFLNNLFKRNDQNDLF